MAAVDFDVVARFVGVADSMAGSAICNFLASTVTADQSGAVDRVGTNAPAVRLAGAFFAALPADAAVDRAAGCFPPIFSAALAREAGLAAVVDLASGRDALTAAFTADAFPPAERAGAFTPTERAGASTPAERAGAPTPAERAGAFAAAERAGAFAAAERAGAFTPAERAGAFSAARPAGAFRVEERPAAFGAAEPTAALAEPAGP